MIVLDIGDGVYVKKKKKNYLQDIQYQSSEDARNNSERQIVQNVNQKEETLIWRFSITFFNFKN